MPKNQARPPIHPRSRRVSLATDTPRHQNARSDTFHTQKTQACEKCGLDSIQLTAKHRVATPANWHQGDDVIITGAVSNEEANKIFPGYKTVKPYLRTVAQPQ